jgi:hypothetical protein
MIKRQQKSLSEFIEKYSDLERAINEYKEEQIQIQSFRKKVIDLEVIEQKYQSQINESDRSIEREERNISKLKSYLEKESKARDNLDKIYLQNLDFITNNQKSIENAKEHLRYKELEF